MKRILIATVCLPLTISCVTTSPQGPPQPAAQQQALQQIIASAEHKWLAAYYSLDAATVAAIESLDFTLITPAGLVSRQMQLRSIRSKASITGPATSPVPFAVTGQAIKIYGDTAILSDLCTVGEGGKNPVTSPGTFWQTQVWHNDGGNWKIIHMHISSMQHGM
jgi:ketosteroid isomerase-like protein